MKFATKAIHAGQAPDKSTGAIMTPIYQTSTYVQEEPGKHLGFEYARTHNPTRTALEANLAALENARFGISFSSGMSAIDAVVRLLKPGDEILSTSDIYGGTYRLFTQVYETYGIKFQFIDTTAVENVERHIHSNTRFIWIETPTNPTLQISDLKQIASIARKNDIRLCVDNTFASPYLQTPIEHGADLVVHSATKYLGGHSDVVMGAVLCNNEDLAEQLYFLQNTCGAIPAPNDCFLVLRGVKTLPLRMKQHCENAAEIAHFLNAHPKVEKVYWPGLKDHPSHNTARKQMRDYGGMVSFALKSGNYRDGVNLLKNTRLFSLAESLGGVESLIGHPASMTHATIPKATREKAGISDTFIRLSVGIEDKEDLVKDLRKALNNI